jgi:predicted nucleic acid-binding protein
MEMNKGSIFLDSNFFIALNKSDDTNFDKSIEIARELNHQGYKLVTSNLIFMEAVTILSQKVSKEVSLKWGKEFLEDSMIDMIHINSYLHNLSWDIFKHIKQKNVSFVDCSSLAVMKEYDLKYIVTFDTTDFKILERDYNFKIFNI